MISKNEAANRKLSGFDGGISRVKWASVYQCDCGAGFRLSPTCSPIRYGLVFPRGCLFIGIVHDVLKNDKRAILSAAAHAQKAVDFSPRPQQLKPSNNWICKPLISKELFPTAFVENL